MASRATFLAMAVPLLAVSLVALTTLPEPATAQNCGCAPGVCCSSWGYCGTGFDYCGDEQCQQGPCWKPLPLDVAGIATQQFFDGVKSKAQGACPGRGFYTWEAFLGAARSFPNFGRLWQSPDDAKREIAAFFAHVTQETGSTLPEPATAQNCGCAPGVCCSRWGYCGTGFDYCGDEQCQQGPCWKPLPLDVAGIATQQFFDGVKSKAQGACPGRGFYTWEAFLDAARFFPNFGRLWQSPDDAKREIAAFFAHVIQETGSLCKVEEDYKGDYCNSDAKYSDYPCAPGRKYYGRGPLQVSWNYNYGAAGRDIGFDGLGAPETLAADARASFKASVWFWMRYARPVMGQGFGATTRAINGEHECDGKNPAAVSNRVRYYREYCQQLGVAPAADRLEC